MQEAIPDKLMRELEEFRKTWKKGDKFIYSGFFGAIDLFNKDAEITFVEFTRAPLFSGSPCVYDNAPGNMPGAFLSDYEVRPKRVIVREGDKVTFKVSTRSLRAYGRVEYMGLDLAKEYTGEVHAVTENDNPLVFIDDPVDELFAVGHGDFWLTDEPLGYRPSDYLTKEVQEEKAPKVFDAGHLNRDSAKFMRGVSNLSEYCTWAATSSKEQYVERFTICHAFLRTHYKSDIFNYPSVAGRRGGCTEQFLRNPSKSNLYSMLNSKDHLDVLYSRLTQWLFSDEMFGCYLNPSYEHAMLNGWLVDRSKPYPIVMTSLVMSRMFNEFPENVRHWDNLVHRGVHPRAAMALCQFSNKLGAPGDQVRVFDRGHQNFDVSIMSVKDVANLAAGVYLPPDKVHSFTLEEAKGYKSVNAAFSMLGEGDLAKKILDCFHVDEKETKDAFGRVNKARNTKVPEGGMNEAYNNLAAMYKKDILPLVGV